MRNQEHDVAMLESHLWWIRLEVKRFLRIYPQLHNGGFNQDDLMQVACDFVLTLIRSREEPGMVLNHQLDLRHALLKWTAHSSCVVRIPVYAYPDHMDAHNTLEFQEEHAPSFVSDFSDDVTFQVSFDAYLSTLPKVEAGALKAKLNGASSKEVASMLGLTSRVAVSRWYKKAIRNLCDYFEYEIPV